MSQFQSKNNTAFCFFLPTACVTSVCLDSILQKKDSSLNHCAWLSCSVAGRLERPICTQPRTPWPDFMSKRSSAATLRITAWSCEPAPTSFFYINPRGMLARSWQQLCSVSLRLFGYNRTVPFNIFIYSLMPKCFHFYVNGRKNLIVCIIISILW